MLFFTIPRVQWLDLSILRPVFFWILTIFIFGSAPLQAQTGFHIVHFNRNDYEGGNQNWDISDRGDGTVFIANNEGLLVLQGSGIKRYSLPSGTSIRSVLALQNRVYTGSFEEIGYWEADADGNYVYTSLNTRIQGYSFKNDEYWKIVALDNRVYFQSFGSILVYENETVRPVEIPGTVLFLLKAGGSLYVQQIKGGLFRLENNRFVLIPGSTQFKNDEIKVLLEFKEDELLIGTASNGLYLFKEGRFTPWKNDIKEELKKAQINDGIRLSNGTFVIGTLLKGVFLIGEDGKRIRTISSANGLQNNTVLAIEPAENGNLWVGLDKGFDLIQFDTPIDVYRSPEEPIGTVYAAAMHRETLYIGTNQGIFRYVFANDRFQRSGMLAGSEGQVWFLKSIDGRLYAGLNDGTSVLLDDGRLQRVSSATGGFNMIPVTTGDTLFYLQGSYAPLVRFSKNGGFWQQDREIAGFTAPIRFLEIDNAGTLLLGHTVRGIYTSRISPNFDSLTILQRLDASNGLPEGTNRFVKIDGRIVFPTPDGLHQWDAVRNRVAPYTELDAQLETFKQAVHIAPVGNGRYWMLRPDEFGLFDVRFGTAKMLYRIIPKMYDLQPVSRYEHATALNDSLHLFCLEDGFAILNLYKLNRLPERNAPPVIHTVEFFDAGQRRQTYRQPNGKLSVASDFNSVSIHVRTPGASHKQMYSYRISGIDAQWSTWSPSATVSYARLPYGEHCFEVRSLSTRGIATDPVIIVFTIRRPWFLSSYGFILEGVLLAILVVLSRSWWRRRKWRIQEKMLLEENQRMRSEKEYAEAQLLKTLNERLHEEVSTKNLELAKNTMLMLRKNESFIGVKRELEALKEELGYRLPAKKMDIVIRMIDEALDSEHDWEHFEHLFDKAHGGFFKRLKEMYPDLTPSDLRLCAYLRMSLTSKEIAPLLNITVRGVEEKRYRLRKRLNLTGDQGLTDFILHF